MKKAYIHPVFFIAGIIGFQLKAIAQQAQKTNLNHIALYVTNLDKSTEFYRDIMQLDVMPNPFNDGKHTWLKLSENSQMHLIQGAQPGMQYYKNSHLCFSVKSVTEFAELLNKKNIVYENLAGETKAVTVRVDGVKQIYFKDPDGYWLEVNDSKL